MIVVPMAGISRRFAEAGYREPKYMLPLNGRSVFSHAVGSFGSYAESLPFLFIARDIADTETFIRTECASLGISDPRIIIIGAPTAGQAETVELGLRAAGTPEASPISIFNIDTFRPNFRFPAQPWMARSDGYLEVFKGEGDNWSYVAPLQGEIEPLVAATREKQPISDLCCVGLYHFNRADDFLFALERERTAPSMPELYVAPLYNHLIGVGRRIHYSVVAREDVLFCGVPSEYFGLLDTLTGNSA